jgi:hypothetical protein
VCKKAPAEAGRSIGCCSISRGKTGENHKALPAFLGYFISIYILKVNFDQTMKNDTRSRVMAGQWSEAEREPG